MQTPLYSTYWPKPFPFHSVDNSEETTSSKELSPITSQYFISISLEHERKPLRSEYSWRGNFKS